MDADGREGFASVTHVCPPPGHPGRRRPWLTGRDRTEHDPLPVRALGPRQANLNLTEELTDIATVALRLRISEAEAELARIFDADAAEAASVSRLGRVLGSG